jgi:ribonuclease E
MEMSRQRLRPALSEGASIPCPRCGGSGHIRDTESSALQILRVIQEESLKDSTASVLCQVPVEVASFLLNEKRTEIAKIELKQRINVLMVPNKSLETPNYKLERLKHDDPRLDNIQASYKMAEVVEDVTAVTRRSQEPTNRQTPVIKGVLPDAPAPVAAAKPAPVAQVPMPKPQVKHVAVPAGAESGFFGWFKSLFAATPPSAPTQLQTQVAESGKDDKRGGHDGRPSRDAARRGESRGDRGPRPDGRGPRGDGRGGNRGRGGDRPDRGQERASAPREQTEQQAASVDGNNDQFDAFTPGMQDASRNEQRPERSGRNDRGNRSERSDRRPRVQRPDDNSSQKADSQPEIGEQTAQNEAGMTGNLPSDESRNDAAPREKRPRDRYGRERKPRGERSDRPENSAEQSVLALGDAPQDDAAPRKSYFTQTVRSTEDAPVASFTPSQESDAARVADSNAGGSGVIPELHAPLASLPLPAAIPLDQSSNKTVHASSSTQPAAAIAPVLLSTSKPANAAMPMVQSFTLPVAELVEVAAKSGLSWVNSDVQKVAAAQSAIAAEPKPVHVPRERPPMVSMDDRPLVLVETRLDLNEVNLPFENTRPM